MNWRPVGLALLLTLPLCATAQWHVTVSGTAPAVTVTQTGTSSYAVTVSPNILATSTWVLTQTPAPTVAPAVTAGGAGLLTGSYYWAWTYQTATGETEYMGTGTPLVLASQSASVTVPALPAGVTSWNLYRTAGNVGVESYALQQVVRGLTGTTYTDNTPDGSLGAYVCYTNTTGGLITVNGARAIEVDPSGVRIGMGQGSGGQTNTYVGNGVAAPPTTGLKTTSHMDTIVGDHGLAGATDTAGNSVLGGYALAVLPPAEQHTHRASVVGENAFFGCADCTGSTGIGDWVGFESTGKNALYLGGLMGQYNAVDYRILIGNQGGTWLDGNPTLGGNYTLTGNHTINGTLHVTGNVTAPNIQPPPDLTPYAQKAVANTFTATQTFGHGIQVGGQMASDAEPPATTITGMGAYPSASVYRTGGVLSLSGGQGQTGFTIADWSTLYGQSVSIYLDDTLPSAALYTLTEGVQYSAQTDNATTALNLAAAVNAWCPGVWASASGATVSIAPTSAATTARPYSGISQITATTSIAGTGYLAGLWRSTGTLDLMGNLSAQELGKSVDPGTTTLNLPTGTLFSVTNSLVATISGGVTGRVVLLRFPATGDVVIQAGAFTPAPGLPTSYTSTAGGWLLLYYDGSAWVEQGRWPLPSATSTQTGLLSSTDWTTFNSKLGSYTETDPVFNAWKTATPPLYAEADTLDTVAGRSGSTTHTLTVDPGAQGAASPPAAAFTAADGTLATAGNPVSASPSYTWTSSAWNTTTSTADVYTWGVWSAPTNGATTSATWKLGVSKNGAAWTFPLTISNGWTVTSIGQINAGTSLTAGSAVALMAQAASPGNGLTQAISGAPDTSEVSVLDVTGDRKARRAVVADSNTTPVLGVGAYTIYSTFGGMTAVNCGPGAVSRGDHLIVSTVADGCAMAGTETSDLYRLGVALSAKAAGDNAVYVSHDAATDIVTVNGTASTWAANQRIVLMGGTFGGLTQGSAYYIKAPSGTPTTSFQVSLTSGGAAIDLTSATVTGSPTFEPTGTVSVWLK